MEQRSNPLPDGLDGSLLGFPEQGFELCEDLFDRVQVGAVGRQEDEPGTSPADGLTNGQVLVGAKIVHHDDIAGLEGRYEHLLDVGKEGLAVDGPVEHEGRRDLVVPQSREKRHCLPVAVRDLGDERPATAVPAPRARHVRFGPGLIDEDEAGGINLCLVFFPAEAAASDVGAVLLGCEQGFF